MNKYKGEVTVRLLGRDWTMRPNFRALAAIESGIAPKTLMILGNEIMTGTVPAVDLVTIVHRGIEAVHGNDTPSQDDIGEAIFDTGWDSVQQPVIDFLTSLLQFWNGPPEDGEKKKRASRRSLIEQYAEAALGALSWTPSEFWDATPNEVRLAIGGYNAVHSNAPLSPDDIEELKDLAATAPQTVRSIR